MDLNKLLTIGERIDLEFDSKAYKSTVQDIVSERTFFAGQPTRSGRPVYVPQNQKLEIVYYRPNGLFVFPALAKGNATSNNVTLLRCEAIGEPEKIQRRQSFRLEIILPVSVSSAMDEGNQQFEPVRFSSRTQDISSYGMLIESPKSMPNASILSCDLTLIDRGWEEETISVTAQVRRCLWPSKRIDPFLLGLMFLDCSERIRQRINRFIMQQQVQMRKRNADFEL